MKEIWNWKEPKDKKPLTYIIGDWDGKKSDPVLVELMDGNYVIATCYEGTMDGSLFFDWYHGIEEYELDVNDIRYWTEIPNL